MNIRTVTPAPMDFASVLGAGRQFVIRIFSGVADGATGFVSSLQAAQSVVRRAEYLRMRSNGELAQAGLSPQDVPAELLREFERCRGHQTAGRGECGLRASMRPGAGVTK